MMHELRLDPGREGRIQIMMERVEKGEYIFDSDRALYGPRLTQEDIESNYSPLELPEDYFERPGNEARHHPPLPFMRGVDD